MCRWWAPRRFASLRKRGFALLQWKLEKLYCSKRNPLSSSPSAQEFRSSPASCGRCHVSYSALAVLGSRHFLFSREDCAPSSIKQPGCAELALFLVSPARLRQWYRHLCSPRDDSVLHSRFPNG